MVKKPVIFQIAGYQNSGKTTLAKKVIENLAGQKMTVVTIKHHGHGGKPAVSEEKDSSQHITSGALASLVEGDGRLLLQAEKPVWLLNEQIEIATYFKPDVILIEGHKNEAFPKIVILRGMEDKVLLKRLKNIQAVFYWDEELSYMQKGYPTFPFFKIHDNAGYDWVVTYLESQCEN